MTIVVLLSVGLAATWSVIAHRELASSLVSAQTERLDRARTSYEGMHARIQTTLQSHARMLVEDPRLKATLATENMDAATVDEILNDLSKLRGAGFFMVLSPNGRVFAESGAKELRGLDLSGSSIVQQARSEPGAAVGTWVLGTKVADLSAMAIRYDDELIAYLTVGQPLDEADLRSLAEQCGCELATVLGNNVVVTSAREPETKTMFTRLGASAASWRGRVVAAGDREYVTNAVDLGDVLQSHRLMLAISIGAARAPFGRFDWLLWVPTALVLVVVLFALSANRPPRRHS